MLLLSAVFIPPVNPSRAQPRTSMDVVTSVFDSVEQYVPPTCFNCGAGHFTYTCPKVRRMAAEQSRHSPQHLSWAVSESNIDAAKVLKIYRQRLVPHHTTPHHTTPHHTTTDFSQVQQHCDGAELAGRGPAAALRRRAQEAQSCQDRSAQIGGCGRARGRQQDECEGESMSWVWL